MKIAVPTRENKVDDHFGHCESYTIFTIDPSRKKILTEEILPSPVGCGCKSGVASLLKEHGVTIMLAGNMGEGALFKLYEQGIHVYRGCSGDVHLLIADFIDGNVSDSGLSCHLHDHEEDHFCDE